MPNNPSLAVVVLYYNTFDQTCACLSSIESSSYSKLNLILVDNNSLNEPVDLLCGIFSIPHLIRLKSNFGFSKGVNEGIKYALNVLHSDYIAIVNSDLVLDVNALADSISSCEDLQRYLPIAAVTGKIMFKTPRADRIWQAGGFINVFKASGVGYGFMDKDHPSFNVGTLTGWASGAFSLFPSKTFKELGVFSEDFFFGQEEWDLSVRILKSNRFIYYNPNMLSWHEVGGSYKGHNPVLNTYNGYCNKIIFAKKWVPFFPLWLMLFFIRTLLVFPRLLRVNCFHYSDILPQSKAILLALLIGPFKSQVTGPHLEQISKLIGTSESWSSHWKVNK